MSQFRVVELVGPEEVRAVDVEMPTLESGEVLVRVEAATTCGTDVKVFRRGGHPRMLRPPCAFGHELAGVIFEAGDTGWSKGERVVVANSAPCGECDYCACDRENLCCDLRYLNGAFGQFLRIPARFVERSLYRIPESLSFEIASLAAPLACVVHGVDACRLTEPAEILLYGAGPIGLLFVGVLASRGHRVVVADPNPSRLEVARELGGQETITIERGGGQSGIARAQSRGGLGYDVAIDATGVTEVWADALASVRPGGTVNLFGGCAPGTSVSLDTRSVHYDEITILGVYHHRPATFREAIEILARSDFAAERLLSAERPLDELEDALRSMMRKEALKVVIRPHR